MLSFGKPFIYEGNEFNHSKKNDSNSYNSPLSVNAIKWEDKKNNFEIFNYTKDLIELRKNIEAFKYTSKDEIENRLKFIEGLEDSLIGYILDNKYIVLINANGHDMFVSWNILDEYIKVNKDKKIVKVFDKEGINKISLEATDGLSLESLSVNVYKIGDTYGL